ncbi:MAG: DUF4923 family protein [Rikenellaceae bacterium]
MNRSKLLLVAVAMLLSSVSLRAQSITDLISSGSVSDVVTSVTGGLTISSSNIVGEWNYVEPAVELSSESLVSSAAGTVVSSQIESKLDTYCSKVGITSGDFAFVFNSDNTFTSNIGSRSLGGSYSVDGTSGTITLKYSAVSSINIGSLTASTTLTSTSLSLLFPADKLLSLFSALASSSSDGDLQLLSSLSEQYDGISIGFMLSGKVATDSSTSSTASQVESAVNAISKFF